jgi:2-polyprenyl-3-methyl-5-hydroxy-6-metoxy-1,4-benzoquinol methylase
MFDFHTNPSAKFEQQVAVTTHYILPFCKSVGDIEHTKVLEVACGEGGVLLPFLQHGSHVTGVDLSAPRIESAKAFFKDAIQQEKAAFFAQNVYDADWQQRAKNAFDWIILKDAIEHIPEQQKLLSLLKGFLSEGGKIVVCFPPWRMPFGGHQQLTSSKFGRLPYYHLLPRKMYEKVLKLMGESETQIQVQLEIHDTRISTLQLERFAKNAGLYVVKRQFWLLNPIYQYKFGWKPRKQLPFLAKIPVLNDFVTTSAYYILAPKS